LTTPDKINDWLVDEAVEVGKRIADLMKADERLLATGFALISAAASVAVANGKPFFLMAVPFALSLLFTFVEYQHSLVMGLGGYKSVLEQAVHDRVGVPVQAWEHVIAPKIHRAPAVLAVRLLASVFYAASVYAALNQALATQDPGSWGHEDSTLYLILTIASIAVGAAAMGVALYGAQTQYETIREITERELLPLWLAGTPPPAAIAS
jgi:hypothetical protein